MVLLSLNTMQMNILFRLIKSKKFFLIFIFLIATSCTEKKNYTIENLEKTINLYGHKGKAIIYRDKSNHDIKNSNQLIFMNGKEILENNNENFFLVNIIKKNENMIISVYSYKSGKALTCHFYKNILKSEQVEYIKMGESKPYYIYFDIMKRKYPTYMNWHMFKIPKDSLK